MARYFEVTLSLAKFYFVSALKICREHFVSDMGNDFQLTNPLNKFRNSILHVDSRKLTKNYRNFTFIRTYCIVVLLQHNKLVGRQQQHSIVVKYCRQFMYTFFVILCGSKVSRLCLLVTNSLSTAMPFITFLALDNCTLLFSSWSSSEVMVCVSYHHFGWTSWWEE